ncbi:hypothetical protein HW555_014380 [Spodoptera exigua]|uniref:DAGKc domain-containing protein n=1 Tax=Spodoptera exigua TaxID=7107 RepID=A0A835G2T9_SPOEX|nr:hypothetical protein HW555_014380 [Spodoptera exigua]
MKKARVIYNPTSGKELVKKNLADILSILEECGYEASAFATTPDENSARNEARRVAELGFNQLLPLEAMELSMKSLMELLL